MPAALIMLGKAALDALIGLAMRWATKLITGPALERVLLEAAEEAAKRTDTKIDDQLVEELKKGTKDAK